MSRSVSTNINETQRSVYALSPPYSDSRNIFNQSPLVSSQSRFAINYPFQFSASDFCFSSPVSSLSRKENLGIVDSYLKSFNFRAILRFFYFLGNVGIACSLKLRNNHGRWCEFRAEGSLLRGE